jgi:phosphonate transport system permease protein
MSVAGRDTRIEALWADRPRDLFLRGSLLALAGLLVAAWGLGDFAWGELLNARRAANLSRFLSEIRPYPLQGSAWSWSVAADWATGLLRDEGADAARTTLAISILAIEIAACAALPLSLVAARNVALAEAFAPAGRVPRLVPRMLWRTAGVSCRLLLALLRAVPEYLWAFVLLTMFGPSAWPAVLALAIHNAGILGRLDAETLENADTSAATALRGIGAGRLQIVGFALLPALLPRLLLYFFYRWETCVREATVLGMLGIVSLGYFIEEARARGHYDTLFFMVGIGVVIVMVGDLASSVARSMVRRAS